MKTDKRTLLKSKLKLIPIEWRRTFVYMYWKSAGLSKVPKEEEINTELIEYIVDHMAENSLDWATKQVDNSISKLLTDYL